jgi:hypothetical protein
MRGIHLDPQRPGPIPAGAGVEVISPLRRRESIVARSKRTDLAVKLAGAAIGLHALDAWVLQPDGGTSLARRALLFGAIAAVAAIGGYAYRTLPERFRETGVFVTGVVALVIQVPVTASYLLKQGLGGSRYTGVVAIAGAMVLTATGATRLIRMARTRWAKWLALPIALVTVQFFVLPVGMAILVTHAARPELGPPTPAAVGLEYEDVTIVSNDGTRLAAWYVTSHNGAAILLRHGSGSTRTALLDHADFLAESG